MGKMVRVLVFKAEVKEWMVGNHLSAVCGEIYGMVEVHRYTKTCFHGYGKERLYITRVRFSGQDERSEFEFLDTSRTDVVNWNWGQGDAAVLTTAIEISKTLLSRAYQAYLEYGEAHKWERCFNRAQVDNHRVQYNKPKLVPFNELKETE